MRRVALALLVMTGVVVGGGAAHAARLALVVGNDGYRQVAPLQNARADARAMAEALEKSGFAVTQELDRTRGQMNTVLKRFRQSVSGGDEVVLFYAGHGVQVGGANYLLPVDIEDVADSDVADEAISLQKVLDDLEERRPRFTLVIVDACRDDPFKTKGRNVGTRGLVPTTAASGQMVVYSAGAGQKALDRLEADDRSPNGVFTRVWLKEMVKPGVAVTDLVKSVRREVTRLARSVNHEQVPALYDQSDGDFFFRRGAERDPEVVQETATGPTADVETAYWIEAKQIGSVAAFRAYLKRYPQGRYADLADAKIGKLEREAYERAVSAVGVEALLEFVEEFPQSTRRGLADAEIKRRKQVGDKPASASPPAPRADTAAPQEATVASAPKYADLQRFRECGECPEMVVIPAGEFAMGSPEGKGDDAEKPRHPVKVSRYALGRYEVTQGQWRALMGSNPSRFKDCGNDCPVESVSWDEARAYIRKLNESVTGKREGPYRLPSEAEWEYGCRGGASGENYCGGDDSRSVAWYGDNSGGKTRRVGTKTANRWGLHDMSGNVWEWVQDCWNDSYRGAPSDGAAWTVGDWCVRRVMRGGAFYSKTALVRSANRDWSNIAGADSSLGFRVARTLP